MSWQSDSVNRGFNKKVFDPEATLRSSESAYDPLIRKQNDVLEHYLEPKPWDIRSIVCSNTFLCLLLIVVLPVSIILGVFIFIDSSGGSDDVCFVETSCSATTSFYNPTTGFTNDTGWASADSTSCCDICLPGTPTKVCFNTTDGSNCMEKGGVAGDYDYVMLDQMWLPQYCNALAQGHDPTLSHLPGTKCNSARTISSSLVIHGLWPNYYDGFPQCCEPTDGGDMEPLVPEVVVEWYPTWGELEAAWYDPTTAPNGPGGSNSNECNICYILNHEWLKHGTCYQQTGNTWPNMAMAASALEGPQGYFHAGVEINDALTPTNTALERYANQNIDTTLLADLYNYNVNIMCDPQDPLASSLQGVFLEVQTCWEVIDEADQVDPTFKMIDCAPASASQFSTPCPATVYLKAYMGPDQNE